MLLGLVLGDLFFTGKSLERVGPRCFITLCMALTVRGTDIQMYPSTTRGKVSQAVSCLLALAQLSLLLEVQLACVIGRDRIYHLIIKWN